MEALGSWPIAQLTEPYKCIASSGLFVSFPFPSTLFIMLDGMFVAVKAPERSLLCNHQCPQEQVSQLFTFPPPLPNVIKKLLVSEIK